MLGESEEYRRLRHAIEKAAGDRERAIKNICRLYGVKTLDALPGAIRGVLDQSRRPTSHRDWGKTSGVRAE
jgi:hypothetical protein